MSVIVYQFQTVKFIQMMSLTFGLFTQVSGSGPLGPLVLGMELMLHPVLGLLKAILKANHTTVTTPLDSVF